jgi:hypothetical protein
MRKIFLLLTIIVLTSCKDGLFGNDLIAEKMTVDVQYNPDKAREFHALVLQKFVDQYCDGLWNRNCFEKNNGFSHNPNIESDRLLYKVVEYCQRYGDSSYVSSQPNPARECLDVMSEESNDINKGRNLEKERLARDDRGIRLFQSKYNIKVMKPVFEKTLIKSHGSADNCSVFANYMMRSIVWRDTKAANFESANVSCIDMNNRVTLAETYKLKSGIVFDQDAWQSLTDSYKTKYCSPSNKFDLRAYEFNNLIDYNFSLIIKGEDGTVSGKFDLNLLSCLS